MRLSKFFIILTIFIFSINIIPVYAEQRTCIYFFYGEGCQHCASVEPLIKDLKNQQQHIVEVHEFEIYNNRSNMIHLSRFFDNYNIQNENRGVPAVFIGNQYLIGDKPILENLESIIKDEVGSGCPDFNGQNMTGISSSSSPLEKLNSLSLLTIIGAALVDSINPCAIAVLLILLGALLASGNKKQAFKAGLAFTLSIYIVYFLFGLGLFSALQVSGLSFWFYKIIGILAIILGLANIKDFFWYGGGGFVMEIPRAWRPKLKKMLSGVTSPFGAFLLGFAVCLFELPCTGGPYIVILGLLAERMTMLASIPLLLIYNLFFVIPLIIITFMIYLGFANVEKTSEWKERNIRKLHLIAGIIMLILGVVVVLGLI